MPTTFSWRPTDSSGSQGSWLTTSMPRYRVEEWFITHEWAFCFSSDMQNLPDGSAIWCLALSWYHGWLPEVTAYFGLQTSLEKELGQNTSVRSQRGLRAARWETDSPKKKWLKLYPTLLLYIPDLPFPMESSHSKRQEGSNQMREL